MCIGESPISCLAFLDHYAWWSNEPTELWYSKNNVYAEGYSYSFQADCNWSNLAGSNYEVYNDVNGIGTYLQGQLESYIEENGITVDGIKSFFPDKARSLFVNPWNNAFPDAFTPVN